MSPDSSNRHPNLYPNVTMVDAYHLSEVQEAGLKRAIERYDVMQVESERNAPIAQNIISNNVSEATSEGVDSEDVIEAKALVSLVGFYATTTFYRMYSASGEIEDTYKVNLGLYDSQGISDASLRQVSRYDDDFAGVTLGQLTDPKSQIGKLDPIGTYTHYLYRTTGIDFFSPTQDEEDGEERIAAFTYMDMIDRDMTQKLKRKEPSLSDAILEPYFTARSHCIDGLNGFREVFLDPTHPQHDLAKSVYEGLQVAGTPLQKMIFSNQVIGSSEAAKETYTLLRSLENEGLLTDFLSGILSVVEERYEGEKGDRFVNMLSDDEVEEYSKSDDQTDTLRKLNKRFLASTRQQHGVIAVPLESFADAIPMQPEAVEIIYEKNGQKTFTKIRMSWTDENDDGVTLELDITNTNVGWNVLRLPEDIPEVYHALQAVALEAISMQLAPEVPKVDLSEQPRVKRERSEDVVYQLKKDMKKERTNVLGATVVKDGTHSAEGEVKSHRPLAMQPDVSMFSQGDRKVAAAVSEFVERYNKGHKISMLKLSETGPNGEAHFSVRHKDCEATFELRNGQLHLVRARGIKDVKKRK